ncbi:hypothetical protein B4U80_10262 [Leptotrombidium deliense]|uniref:Elongation of very long chain fatty acids protein n=1 Tax=Leptotrombidium deliense TaxID=299467 RepID=A0A443SEC3_9ACAR|nr:hypothetical protein B4U80_10262 [Leptotrombidium deliense]
MDTISSLLNEYSSILEIQRVINSSLSNTSLVVYVLHDFWNEVGDPRITKLPFLNGGPFAVLFCVFLYLIGVTISQKFMETREAFDLRQFMLLYNSLLVMLNLAGCAVGFWFTNFGLETWFCKAIDRNDLSFETQCKIHLGFSYFVIKFIEFTDTFLFVFRKKKNQITFLHLFHHSIMPLTAWFGVKFHPGGMTGFTPLVNSAIHTVMHYYYGLSAIGPSMAPYLWWKKYITLMQMAQFTAVFFHGLHAFFIPNCSWPILFRIFEMLESFIFFVMFLNFYLKNYKKKQF